MKLVLQTVSQASCTIDNKIYSNIENGFVILVGFTHNDTEHIVDKMVDKVLKLRIFEDENMKINKNIFDENGKVLSISQFTLYANCKNGNRPSFTDSLNYKLASKLYDYFNSKLIEGGIDVKTGVFGADMHINLTNVGPKTIILDSKELF